MKLKTTILCLLLCVADALGADTLQRADIAYSAGRYAEAVALYNEAAESEGTSAGLLYNLGNAAYQTGDYGTAMASWLRARRLNPSDADINHNIAYLQSKVEDQNKAEQRGRRLAVTPDEPSFFGSLHRALAENVASDRWAGWGAACFVLFVGMVALYIFSRNVAARKTGFFGSMGLLTLTVIFVTLAFMSARAAEASDEGVVSAFKVALATEAGKAPAQGKGHVLTKGTRVRILSEESDAEGNVTWVKVRLNSDYIGWVPASDIIQL